MYIKTIANALCKKHLTRDPFVLADSLGVIVLFEPLGEIKGYYNRCYRQKFIHINRDLDEHASAFACAHEIGHTILHPKMNTPFLKSNTLFSVDKLELQANHFALDLLYDDYDLLPFLTRPITDAAVFMGVPVQLAEYRLNAVQPRLFSEFI